VLLCSVGRRSLVKVGAKKPESSSATSLLKRLNSTIQDWIEKSTSDHADQDPLMVIATAGTGKSTSTAKGIVLRAACLTNIWFLGPTLHRVEEQTDEYARLVKEQTSMRA
jgi:hypothetical protein